MRARMAVPLPADYRLAPSPGTWIESGRVQGGVPRVRIDLEPRAAAAVAALLNGVPVGNVTVGDVVVDDLARRLCLLDIATARPGGRTPDATMRVAGVIPARNATATIAAAVRSLGAADEVVVVDDGSTDDTAAAAEAAGARVVRLDTSGGPAAARNEGVRHTDADVIVFLDADVEADPSWIDPLLAHLADPLVAGAAPRVRTLGGDSLVGRYEASSGALDLGTEPGTVRPTGRIPFVSTTALVVRRNRFLEIGGFDDDLRFGEDLDLVWRLAASGTPVQYEPASCVRHHHRSTVDAHLRNQYAYATASGELERRHGRPRACLAPPLLATGALAATLGARRPGIALAGLGFARTAWQLRRLGVAADDAIALAARASIDAARGLAASISRPWLPLAVLVASLHPPARLPVGAAVLGRWGSLLARRESIDGAASWLLVRALEDAAHSAGTLRGCMTARRAGPLLPARPATPTTTASDLGIELVLP